MDDGGQRGGLEVTRGGQGGGGGGGSNEGTILFNKIASNRHITTTRKRSSLWIERLGCYGDLVRPQLN